MESLKKVLSSIKPLEQEWVDKGYNYLNSLAMPPGALGEINSIAAQLCGIQKTIEPVTDKRVIALCAADHGVVNQGVSNYPQITSAIVKTALNGGAAINAFCEQSGTELKIIDCGLVNSPQSEELMDLSIADGTGDFSQGPAMREEQCLKALDNGIRYGEYLSRHYDVVGLGEMGIGNTTSASALTAAFLSLTAEEVTGPGTGVCGEALANKVAVVHKALAINSPDKNNPLDVLHKVGGFEIVTLTGLILGLASSQTAIVIDGFITTAAALAAHAFNDNSIDYCFAGHLGAEPGHVFALNHLKLKPIVKMNMRLGEGTGAALAMNALQTASLVLNRMMTLEEALAQ